MATRDVTTLKSEFSYPVINMGIRLQEMKRILRDYEQKNIINRIWRKDHTVWKKDPTEISNRLGWLEIIDQSDEQWRELELFADEIKDTGFHHIVLLGMGGSSLGPEVIKRTFGNGAGYPTLTVLDSTHPGWVESVRRAIEPQHTLFLVSSKSGTTLETISLYKYFRGEVERYLTIDEAGQNFVAITDAQTPLVRMAQDHGFRRIFINPSDIGGRYSVLSYFGMVPAALTGVDIRKILKSAAEMQESCAACVNIEENAGAWLGVLTGSFALHGRNKLTFIISPSISSFGLWVEQLLAESTGKEGKGIIPVVDEPVLEPEYYGDDRLFVYIRMKGDKNKKTDEAVVQLEVAGQPIIQLEIENQYDLGSQFFLWEFATAVCGTLLAINPFDQPDVQSTKESAVSILRDFSGKSKLKTYSGVDPRKWFDQLRPDQYVAIMAYLKPSPSIDRALTRLRRAIVKKYHTTTTLGYGPRFLHSTGQLHKGGPGSGLYLQITASRLRDLRIPGESYTMGMLTEALAAGDYLALESKGKSVLRLQLCSESGAAIDRMIQELFHEFL